MVNVKVEVASRDEQGFRGPQFVAVLEDSLGDMTEAIAYLRKTADSLEAYHQAGEPEGAT